MALNLAPFGRWTLRDKAAQRRWLLRWASRTSHAWNVTFLLRLTTWLSSRLRLSFSH